MSFAGQRWHLLYDMMGIGSGVGQAAFTYRFGRVGLANEKPSNQGLLRSQCEASLSARFGETQRVSGPVAGVAREMMIYVS
jgi:hypothetical protein